MTKAAESIEIALPDDVLPGWRRTRLGEIGEYINGRGFKKSEWAEQGLPIIRIQNLTGSGKEQNYYDGEIDERHVVNPGDLLISWAATLGAYLWAGPRAALNQHIFKVRSFVDKKFHYYLMQHILGDLYRQTHGSGMVHITKSKFDSMPIVVPETEYQQKRIVEEIEKQFSRLDEAVANLKRVKANLKRYKAAVLKAAVEGRLVETEAELARREGRSFETGEQLLQRILETRRSQWQGKGKYKEPAAPDTTDLPELPEGWVWANFESAANRVTVGHVGSMKDEYVEEGVPFLRSQNVRANRYDPEGLKFVSEKFHRQLGKSSLKPGDIVVVRSGSVGVTCVIPDHLSEANCSDLVIIKAPRAVLPDFGAYYMNSVVETRVAAGKVGIALTHFNTQSVAELPLPIPPMAEQHRIVAEVERRLSILRATEEQVDANLQRAERLRQTILMGAFSGGIHRSKVIQSFAAIPTI